MTKKLEEVLSGVPDYVQLRWVAQELGEELDEARYKIPTRISLVIAFGEVGFGFGELTLVQDEHGQLFLDTETMGKKGAIHFLKKLVEGSVDDEDQDPVRHARYNEVRGRRCGEHCKVCRPRSSV